MKKKIIVATSILFGVIALLVLLSFTAFSLRVVEIDYRTSHAKITQNSEEIVESGKFCYGGSVFFHGKKEYIERIEKLNPYIKVVNIETKFPSIFVVHIAERQEIFAIPYENGSYICDEQFKILNILEKDVSVENYLEIVTDEFMAGDAKVYEIGQTINLQNKSNIYQAFFENNRDLGAQKTIIKSIEFSNEYDNVVKKTQGITTLNFHNGQTYKIYNDSYGLSFKVKLLLNVYSQMFDFIGKEVKQSDGSMAIITEENLLSSTIVIKNYYDYTRYTEKDCFFDIII